MVSLFSGAWPAFRSPFRMVLLFCILMNSGCGMVSLPDVLRPNSSSPDSESPGSANEGGSDSIDEGPEAGGGDSELDGLPNNWKDVSSSTARSNVPDYVSPLARERTDIEPLPFPDVAGSFRVPEMLRPFRSMSRTYELDRKQPRIVGDMDSIYIQIDPSQLKLPPECEDEPILARVWDIQDPFQSIANGLPLSSTSAGGTNDEPYIMESSGMFHIELSCGEQPVELKPEARLLVGQYNQDNKSRFYSLGVDGWEEIPGNRREEYDRPGTLIRIPMTAERPALAASSFADWFSGGHTGLWRGRFNGDGFEVFVEEGERGLLFMRMPGHESQFIHLEGGKDSIRTTQKVHFPALNVDDFREGWSLLRRRPLSEGSPWPTGRPEGCFLSIHLIAASWDHGGFPGLSMGKFARVLTWDGQEVSPDAIPVDLLFWEGRANPAGRICLKKEIMPDKGMGIIVQIPRSLYQLDPPYDAAQGPLVYVEEITEPTEITLVLKPPRRDYLNYISRRPSLMEQEKAYKSISDLGTFNLDYPRTDLACVEGKVDSEESYMVSAVGLHRNSQTTTWHNETGFKVDFLKGEAFRLLIVSGSRAMATDELLVGERGRPGPDGCLNIGNLELKEVPEHERQSPERFRAFLGI